MELSPRKLLKAIPDWWMTGVYAAIIVEILIIVAVLIHQPLKEIDMLNKIPIIVGIIVATAAYSAKQK